MGQYDSNQCSGGIYLVVTAADVDQLRVKDPQKLAFVTQTTLSMDDTAKVISDRKLLIISRIMAIPVVAFAIFLAIVIFDFFKSFTLVLSTRIQPGYSNWV